MNVLRNGLLVCAMLGMSLGTSLAADINGTWLTQGGTATVRLESCGDSICGTIIALKEPNDPDTGKPQLDVNNANPSLRKRPIVGIQVVLSMKPNGGANKWTGRIYNAEDGQTYPGKITLKSPSSLRVEGCALGGMICQGETWTRAS